MPQTINVAVIGPIPRDYIATHLGESIEKYGCAIYTAVVLSTLAGEGFHDYTFCVANSRFACIRLTVSTVL